ncbi:hypothetical protein C8F04DRAFT_1114083 [Mycena alexandri]|uniref:Uncharacterized protein n=1 Tax=Mycena alexandri TaxID=1745969 RepID=A0AAD6SPP0_9AGAR|nr:hypothetical protein C8F04DRAFT_1114083 [Mycena alexandri]
MKRTSYCPPCHSSTMTLTVSARVLRVLFDTVVEDIGKDALCGAIQCCPQFETETAMEDLTFPPVMLGWAAKDFGVSEFDVKMAAKGLWLAVKLAKEEGATASDIHDEVRRIQGRQPQADQDRVDRAWSAMKRAANGGRPWQGTPPPMYANQGTNIGTDAQASRGTESGPKRKDKIVQRKAADDSEEE